MGNLEARTSELLVLQESVVSIGFSLGQKLAVDHNIFNLIALDLRLPLVDQLVEQLKQVVIFLQGFHKLYYARKRKQVGFFFFQLILNHVTHLLLFIVYLRIITGRLKPLLTI